MRAGVVASGLHIPPIIFVDNFDRPDSNNLGSSWSSVIATSGLMILDQRVRNSAGARTGTLLVVGKTFGPDQYIEADVSIVNEIGNFRSVNLLVRGSTERSGYELQLRQQGPTFNLYSLGGSTDAAINDQVVPEGAVLLSTGSTPSMPFRARLQVIGNNIKAWAGDSPILDITDDTHTSGMPGIGLYRGALGIDSVEAGSL